MNSRTFLVSIILAGVGLAAGFYLGRRAPAAALPASKPSATASAADRTVPDAAAVAAENARLKADVARLGAEVAALAEANAKPAAPAAPAVPTNAAAAAQEARAKALADGQAFLAENPAAREILLNLGRAQAGRNFAQIPRLTSITAAQVEELEKQTADFMITTAAISPTGGISPLSAELPEAQARALLGDAGYREYLDYRRMMPLVSFASEAASLSVREPISPDQMTRLVRSLADANAAFQSGGRADNQTTDWNRVYEEARTFLSPTQMAALQAQSQGPRLAPMIRQFQQNREPAR